MAVHVVHGVLGVGSGECLASVIGDGVYNAALLGAALVCVARASPTRHERMAQAAPALSAAAPLVRSSHENFDGSGYPDGLARDDIPLGARIIAVCDAYDAMISDRAYRRALDREHALGELRRCAGTQFDPDVVRAFITTLERSGARTTGWTAAA